MVVELRTRRNVAALAWVGLPKRAAHRHAQLSDSSDTGRSSDALGLTTLARATLALRTRAIRILSTETRQNVYSDEDN